MSEVTTACILKYLVKGISPSRESQRDLQHELAELLPNAISIVILPVVEGYTVELEIPDYSPFTRTSFEPYVAEHILPDAVAIHCRPTGTVQFQLLRAHYQ